MANNQEKKSESKNYVSIRFQLILIIFSLSIFFFMLYWRLSFFVTHEIHPDIHSLTPHDYEEFGGIAKPIEVGLLVQDFMDFEMVSNEFMFDGIIWFTFSPGTISIETLSQFAFEKGEIIRKSPPSIKLIADKLNVQYEIRVKFNSDLNYEDFPIDNHEIYIVLIDRLVSPDEVFFQSSATNLIVQADVSNKGWNLADKMVRTGYFESPLDPHDPNQVVAYPGAVFTLDYSRNSIRYALSIILPLAMIFYLTLFSISIPILNAIASVTAILAYRFVIENLSPKTGFFMLSDYLFFMFLALTVAIFVINISDPENIPAWVKKLLIIIMHAIVIVATIYLYW